MYLDYFGWKDTRGWKHINYYNGLEKGWRNSDAKAQIMEKEFQKFNLLYDGRVGRRRCLQWIIPVSRWAMASKIKPSDWVIYVNCEGSMELCGTEI